MVTLWFPQKLSFAFLRNTLKEKKERSFKNQQLNIATDPSELDVYINQFTLDALRASSYARSAAPKQGEMRVIQMWDVAYGERKTSDFSVGATVGIYLTEQKQEAVVVLEVVLGKWASSELPLQMAAFYEKYKGLGIERVYIEDALGVKFLIDNIKNFCKIRGLDFSNNIRLLPMSLAANAKRNRIKNLEFLLGHKRLHFVTGAWL
jgi:phage terminase large subunit-like protein